MIKSFLKRLCFIVSMFFLSTIAWAQMVSVEVPSKKGADELMRSNGKIYVVMAVCIVILLVLFLYLIRIDRKISRKEKL